VINDEAHVNHMMRQAVRADIPAMRRVRMSVTENRLTSSVVTDADYLSAIEVHGRGWVVEEQGEVVAFAVGCATDGNIWALFVHPGYEGRGYGRQLHDAVVTWLHSQGLRRLWLTTSPGTRAQRFYELAGWQHTGDTGNAEMRFELTGPALQQR
jgi:GNAT superfamily N-acetyltransferase